VDDAVSSEDIAARNREFIAAFRRGTA